MKLVIIAMILIIVTALTAVGCAIYFIAHPVTPKKDKTRKIIACVGDSITYGAGVIGHRKTSTYPVFLQTLVTNEYQVLNYGLSGRTLQNEGDMPYCKEKFFKCSQDAQANVYILMLGTNDSKPHNWNAARYEVQLRQFVASYQKLASHPRVYLMQPPKCFPEKGKQEVAFDISNDIISNEIHSIVAKIASETGTYVIDLYTLTENHPEWFADGVHPTAQGNFEIARKIAESFPETMRV